MLGGMDKFFKRTKIVATLGPKTSDYESIKKLIENGANVLRLNTSHGDISDHQEKFNLVRKISSDLGVYVGVMVDLQGPKIRLGVLNSEFEIKNGEKVIFESVCSPDTKEGQIVIPVDYAGISKDVRQGSKMLIDDGKIEVEVEHVENGRVFARVINGGVVKSRKGLNIPGCTASLEAVSERDVKFIEFAVKNDAEYIALSFVRSKEDVLTAKKHIENFGGNTALVSKIEKPQAIDNLREIISESDIVMVARGDLGIELTPYEVPICQKIIIDEANRQRKGVIVATQMLESMISEPIPTRAEASDVANAILDGADAVMLSGETSVGEFASEAVWMMSKIASETEKSSFYKYDLEIDAVDNGELTRQAVVFGADKMLSYVNAKAILTFSHNGYSARLMSKLKPKVPIIVLSDLEKTCRKLALIWGVYPYKKDWDTIVAEGFLLELDEFLMGELGFEKDEYVVITGSAPNLMSGRTNTIRVHRVGA